jgi:dihydrolipoamide dehydrogenase
VNKLRTFKDNVVKQLTSGTGQLAKARKITYIRGWATITSPTTLDVAKVEGGTEQVTFAHAIVAVGSQPSKVPGLSLDSPRIMDSTSALELQDVPKTLLVIGGGYIGLELGSVYAALGSKVTVVEMTPGLLPGRIAISSRFCRSASRRSARRCC